MASKLNHNKLHAENSEQVFYSLMKKHPDGLIHFIKQEQHFHIKYINESAIHITGLSGFPVLNENLGDLAVSDDLGESQAIADVVTQLLATTTGNSLKFTWPSGIDSEVRHTLEFNEQGDASHILVVVREITQQKSMHIQQEQDKDELSELTKNTIDDIARYDLDGRILYLNSQLEALLGVNLADIKGKTPLEVWPQGEFDELFEIIKGVAVSGKEEEYCLTYLDGDEYYFLIRLIAERDENGTVCGVNSFGRDITKIKRDEIKSEQEKVLLKTFFNALVDMVWVKDISGKFLACNPAAEKFFGILEMELIGKTDIDLVGPELGAFFIKKDKEAIAAGGPTINEEWIVGENGRRALFETTKAPLFDTKGNIIGTLGFAHDITEKKEVKAQLLTMLDNHPDVIIRYDRDFRRLYANQNYEKMTRLSVKDAIGQRLQDHPRKSKLPLDEFQAKLELVLENGRPEQTELEWLDDNGLRAIYDLRIIPEFNPEGKLTSLLTIGRDVSEIRQAERLLKIKEREYRTLVENSPDIIIRYDRECRRTFVNQTYLNHVGIPAERVLNRRINDETVWLATTMTWQEYSQQLKQVMRTGNHTKITLDWINEDGLKFNFELFVVPEYSDSGEVNGVLAIGRDNSERNRMQEQIVYRENKFRTLAENSPSIIIRHNPYFRCVYTNPAFAKIKEIAYLDTLNGVPDELFNNPITNYKAVLMQVMETGEQAELFLELPEVDSNIVRSFSFNVVAERSLEGKILGTLVIGHDITAIKESENKLAQLNEQLRGLAARLVTVRDETQKSIAREMHDELGQYLTALRLEIAMLPMKLGEGNQGISKQSKELTTLVDNVIQVVRDMAISLRPAPLDIGVVSALEWLTEEFSNRTDVPCSLNTDESDIILDDKYSTAIFRIVQESLTNVTRHAKASQVNVTFNRHEHDYILEIKDNGEGFDPSDIKLKSLGLIGIRERAFMLDGELSILSGRGSGTTISVKIPVKEVTK